MLNLRLRPAVGAVVDPLASGLLRAGVGPDAVTVAGTTGAVLGSALLLAQGSFFWGTVVVTLSVLTDLLDGAMARELVRRSGPRGPFGAWLDSTCDRLADMAVFSALLWWGLGNGDDAVVGGLALFCLVSGTLVSYAKARAEGLGLRCDVGLAERAERLILVLGGSLLAGLGLDAALPVALGLLAAASAVTVVQRLLEVRRQAVAPGS